MNWIVYPLATIGAVTTTLWGWGLFLAYREARRLERDMDDHWRRCEELHARHDRRETPLDAAHHGLVDCDCVPLRLVRPDLHHPLEAPEMTREEPRR